MCLRGRRHHDLVQSAVQIGGGLAATVAVIVKKTAVLVEKNWQIRSVVVLLVLIALIVAFGLVAPAREFSPVARRWVEIIEYVASA